jgi:hypothetical protein
LPARVLGPLEIAPGRPGIRSVQKIGVTDVIVTADEVAGAKKSAAKAPPEEGPGQEGDRLDDQDGALKLDQLTRRPERRQVNWLAGLGHEPDDGKRGSGKQQEDGGDG